MTFEIEIHSKNITIDDRLNNYLEKKISKLERYIKEIINVRVELTKHKSARNVNDRNVVQITMKGGNYLLRAEERTDDVYSAFDAALKKLQRRIERYKGKHFRGSGDRALIGEEIKKFEERDLIQDEDESLVIVKRKKFTIKPMGELEAIEQMNLLGHEDFFLFYNSDTNLINLLYRRREQGYGIIETEIG